MLVDSSRKINNEDLPIITEQNDIGSDNNNNRVVLHFYQIINPNHSKFWNYFVHFLSGKPLRLGFRYPWDTHSVCDQRLQVQAHTFATSGALRLQKFCLIITSMNTVSASNTINNQGRIHDYKQHKTAVSYRNQTTARCKLVHRKDTKINENTKYNIQICSKEVVSGGFIKK